MANKPKEKMPISERAKQFAPFSPLKGLYRELEKKEKIRVRKKELSDDLKEDIGFALSALQVGQIVTVVYYYDEEYIQITGMVSLIDTDKRILQIVKTLVPFEDIYMIRL